MSHGTASTECIFCSIIAGKIPCARVYEDDTILAFLDINPIAAGHTLVVPKGHYPTLLEMPKHLGESLFHALRLVAASVHAVTGADGFNCVQNNFRAAGQMVFHAHWHVIPRLLNDGLVEWPGAPYPDAAAAQQMAAAIAARISENR